MRPLDQTEVGIISLLQEDGRMSVVDMAKKLGVTDGTVRRKVNQLIRNEVIKPTVVCDPHRIGFDTPAYVAIQADQKKALGLAEEVSKLPEVQSATSLTGPYEIMIQILVKSNKELSDFLFKLSELDGIKSTQTFLILKTFKQTWNIKHNHVKEDKWSSLTVKKKVKQI